MKQENLDRLKQVAKQLGALVDELVFLGGCTTALLITEETIPDVRATLDVDCIVDVIYMNEYHKLGKRLAEQGFQCSMSDDIICRWRCGQIILDVMPTDESILGFSNKWYKDAILQSATYHLSDNIHIKAVTAPYFIATKLEAFKIRGNMDFLSSHDFEDIVTVLDGRSTILEEIKNSDKKVRDYLVHCFNNFYNNRAFHDALPGHFNVYGPLANERSNLFVQKIKSMFLS